MARIRREVPFEAISPPARVRLSDSIVGQIERLILEGELRPGDLLPPEREFAVKLDVSRPSLREALLKLESRGLVAMRRGGGYSVSDVTAPTLTDPLVHLLQKHPPAAYDILELRHGLEEMAAFLAAERATDADRELIRKRYAALVLADKSRGTGDPMADAETDLEFHLAIADASHNVALMHVMRGLFNLLRTSTFRFRQLIADMHDGGERMLHEQHRAVYDAVMKGAPDAAREAAHIHLAFLDATLREAESHGTPAPRPGPKAKKGARKPTRSLTSTKR